MELNYHRVIVPDRVIRMELISFFIRYPKTSGYLKDIVQYLGRNLKQVERQLDELTCLRILKREFKNGRPSYEYVPAKSPNFIKRSNRKKTAAIRLPGYFKSGYNSRFQIMQLNKNGEEATLKTDVRQQLLIATNETKSWRECVELLLEAVNRVVGVTCSAYLLRKKYSEVVWNCRRGASDPESVTSEVDQNEIVIDGELIRNKGLLDTVHYIKYLHPFDDKEALMICVLRENGYHIDIEFLASLFMDFVPVVAEKRRLGLRTERTAEKLLQENIYWATFQNQDMHKKGMDYILASLAKCTEASRVSLLIHDGETSLKTLIVYGARKNMDLPAGSFPLGKGLAGWCVENGKPANVIYAREDPRYISRHYDDIETMLCCPMMLPGGKVIGALCAVNKAGSGERHTAAFDLEDMSFLEGTANSMARVISLRRHNDCRSRQAQSLSKISFEN
jgi:GAF domain